MKRIIYLICILSAINLACALQGAITQPPVTSTPSPVDSQTQGNALKKPSVCVGVVTVGRLNLRSLPDYTAPADGAGLVNGQTVVIVGYVGEWLKVETQDGRNGYANSKYIKGCE